MNEQEFSDIHSIRALLISDLDGIQIRSQNPLDVPGLRTGFNDFDAGILGLRNSEMIVVAGRPGVGKTSFAMNIVEYVSLKSKIPVLVFSLGMTASALSQRMISSIGRIRQHHISTGRFAEEEWPRITTTLSLLKNAKIYICDTVGLTPDGMRERCRFLKNMHGLGLIVVDYLQLMRVVGHEGNRVNETSEIARSLKELAKEFDVPLIALSSVNRAVESRTDRRPLLSDLRESGAIEDDADIVTFIYRDDYYDKNAPARNVAEIIVAKNRNGPTGTVKLRFTGIYTRFDNMDLPSTV